MDPRPRNESSSSSTPNTASAAAAAISSVTPSVGSSSAQQPAATATTATTTSATAATASTGHVRPHHQHQPSTSSSASASHSASSVSAVIPYTPSPPHAHHQHGQQQQPQQQQHVPSHLGPHGHIGHHHLPRRSRNPVSSGGASGSSWHSASSSSSGGSKNVSHRPAVFDKLEQLVQDMQDDEHGVPVRSQKMFLTSIPAAFMGYDLIEWLMDRLSIEDSPVEAVHLANLLCQFGYYFPVNELKNLIVKDDSSLYRFQTPYYWPSQHHTPDNIEYAIYLAKRSQRNKQKHQLEDYEVEAYNNLRKILTNKWDFVCMQADEQLKLNKDRKKGDKIVTDSQEKAYWRVYRPPPGFTTVVETCPVPTREQRVKARSRTREHLTEEVEFLRNYCMISRCRVSQVVESLNEYTEDFYEFDVILNGNCVPSNPWITDDQTYWMLNNPVVDIPTERRVRKWGISLEDLISDTLGVQNLMSYMKKEFSHENLRFWLAVQELKTGPGTELKIKKKVKEIWDEFLSPGAKAEINIDGKTMEATRQAMRGPTRYTFEEAAEHVYNLLLKKDCYPRFLRSDHYKNLMANSITASKKKATFMPFGGFAKKKPSAATATVDSSLTGQSTLTSRSTMEGCLIYGADGAESDNLEFQESNSRDPTSGTTNVCPWDIGGTGTTTVTAAAHEGPASTDVVLEQQATSSLPRSHGGTRVRSAEAGSTVSGTGNSLSTTSAHGHQPQASSSRGEGGDGSSTGLHRESSRRSHGGRSGEGGHRHHHHHRHDHDHEHHRHEHHHASKRAKSKSKRKKKGIGQRSTSTSTAEKDAAGVASTAEMLAAGTAALMSTAATSGVNMMPGSLVAATTTTTAGASTSAEGTSVTTDVPPSTLSSIAVVPIASATAVAVQSGTCPSATAPSSSPLKASSSVDLPPGHAPAGSASAAVGSTSSKCTQTRLDPGVAMARQHQQQRQQHHSSQHQQPQQQLQSTSLQRCATSDPSLAAAAAPSAATAATTTAAAASRLASGEEQKADVNIAETPQKGTEGGAPSMVSGGAAGGSVAPQRERSGERKGDPPLASSHHHHHHHQPPPPTASSSTHQPGPSSSFSQAPPIPTRHPVPPPKPTSSSSSSSLRPSSSPKAEEAPSQQTAAAAASAVPNLNQEDSTEVCPWEDENTDKDVHSPFTKTYATLGYL